MTNQTASTKSQSVTRQSVLPGILARAVAIIGFAAIQVAGMSVFQWRGSLAVIVLVVTAFVYFGAMGFQRWRARRSIGLTGGILTAGALWFW
jgi:hypothetical protein